MDVSLATQVYNAYRAAVNTNDITGGVNNSALSAEGKIQLLSLIRDSKTLNKTNIATYLTNHVSQINDSKTIGTNEKALLLTIDAIVYNNDVWSTRTVEGGFSGNYVENPCIFFGGAGSFETGGTACIIGGAIIGGVIGYTICGWPCAIGGAILGGILGGVSS